MQRVKRHLKMLLLSFEQFVLEIKSAALQVNMLTGQYSEKHSEVYYKYYHKT